MRQKGFLGIREEYEYKNNDKSTFEGRELMYLSHNLEMALPGVVSRQTEQDDVQLVQASQQGDQEAFAVLVQRHQRHIFNLSWRMLQDDEDAGEITQEIFLAAWQGLPAFRGEARFSTWLHRIAYRCCLQQLERRKRERSLHSAIQAEQLLEGVHQEKQVEDILEQRDQQAIVREQLELLPARYRIVLILRHFQEMTYEEIADILSLPVGTVKTHLFRARNLLKERLLAQHLCAPVS